MTIYEFNDYQYVPHGACENAKVWDWLRYQGGACAGCEAKFKAEWEALLKNLTAGMDRYLAICGIGKRHRRCSIDNFEGSDSVKKACQTLIDSPADAVLTGLPGTGKTHLVAGMVRGMILNGLAFPLYHRGSQVIFKTIPDFFSELRAGFHKHAGEDGAIERLTRVPVLFLDDLGAERPSEWVISTLYKIVDARYREELATIFTTNLSLDEIAGRLHPRIASRLSGGKIIKLTGPDYRAKRSA